MAYIKINTKYPLYDGMPLTFKAPCDCTAAEGLTVNSTNFIFKDAHGNALAGTGNLFGKGALVKVILDKTNRCAYIQNADSNKYLEDRMSAIAEGVVNNGGSGGDGGSGLPGATFTPHVSEDGVLSWTNNRGLANPDPINIAGADGKSAYSYAQEGGYSGTEAEYSEDMNPDNIKAEVTPELGVDYFTEDDKEDIAARVFVLIKDGGVVGFVDENNNIVLSGNVADGTYTVKYEMEDGSTIDIGNLVLSEPEPEPTYTNLADPTSADWKEGYRLNGSGEVVEVTDGTQGVVLTHYIDCQQGDVLRIKGITLGTISNLRVALYTGSTTKTNYACANPVFPSTQSTWDCEEESTGVYKFTIKYSNTSAMRFSGILVGSSNDVIITKNEAI